MIKDEFCNCLTVLILNLADSFFVIKYICLMKAGIFSTNDNSIYIVLFKKKL